MKVLRVSHSAVVDAWRERERALRRRGLEVDLVSARVWDEGGRLVPLEPRAGEPVVGARTLGSHPALFLFDPRTLWRALGRPHDVLDLHEEPYALVTAEILALRAARRAWDRLRGRRPGPRAPYLVYSAQNIYKRYPVPFGLVERAVLRRAGGVHVCNDATAGIARRKGATCAVPNIPLGVDLAVFAPAPGGRAAERAPGARAVVGYAGRLVDYKGVDVLVRAVLADDGLELRLAGAGPLEAELRSLAAPAGARITFVGSLSGDALVSFYRGLDVLAVPSLDTPGWLEQFGRVAVEAMACGTPVVASRSGALPDVVGDAGILVPQGDSAALGDALRRVTADPVLAATLRERGLEVAARCSWEAVAAQYEELYRRALGAAPVHGTAPAAPAPPEVVLVAYGSPELVRTALEPLVGKLPLTIVDNSSLPAVREAAELAGARYLDPGSNGGFAAGVNHALAHRQTPGSDVLLLNPDARITAEGVLALQEALHADPRTASVGPRQVDDAGAAARVGWPFPSPGRAWAEAAGLGRLPTRGDRSFVIGSVLLLRAEALADVGGFDERFFLYSEETDWAYRAHRRAWRHRVVDQVLAHHTGAATSADPVRREAHFHASQEKYYRKHFGVAGWTAARLAVIAGAGVRAVVRTGAARTAELDRLRLYVRGPWSVETALTGVTP
ncbi:glycosyltransferase [Xylanimonas protaetiae]|uniref:D-inositol 3-phosphate glycosyltransferase n=1 Tax=Xylanimonas protaetiae TaxID=2509457 RepID=A0A4P6F719_9MICO|nr:glycosyltransferase [Xylanimonas protaetiae]QAY69027.1 glycosyltransferase [Xylanimonas protaetiae]